MKVKRGPQGTLLLDDRWLNEVEEWLTHTATVTERELGTKPALEDLRRLIETVLTGGSLEGWLVDGDRRMVVSVAFKTAPRPKIPKKLAAGHLLSIPLRNKRFAFARMMRLDAESTVGSIVEIFRQTRPRPICDRAVLASGRALRPIVINPVMMVERGPWRVVGFDRDFRVSKADRGIEFTFGTPSGKEDCRVFYPFDRGRVGRRLTTKQWWALAAEEEWKDLPSLEKKIRSATH